jgi:hypothetical protein
VVVVTRSIHEEAQLGDPVETVGSWIAELHLHDPPHLAAVADGEVAGLELHALEHARVHEAGEPSDVIELRHRRAFEKDLAVEGVCAAQDGRPTVGGRA